MDRNIKYKHTQVGYLMWYVLFGVVVLFGFIALNEEVGDLILGVMGVILFIMASFTSLEVAIDDVNLRIKFGYGILRKKFLLEEIVSVQVVKNHWYYGWGIRIWLWPRMVIFNVSGYDAVEIIMKNGKVYRIGTDEPQILENVLSREVKIH